MVPTKNFNLVLPFAVYRSLKYLSAKEGKPISEIVRKGIDLILENKSCRDATKD